MTKTETYLYQIDHLELIDEEIRMITHLFNCSQQGAPNASKENYEFIALDFILDLLQKSQAINS